MPEFNEQSARRIVRAVKWVERQLPEGALWATSGVYRFTLLEDARDEILATITTLSDNQNMVKDDALIVNEYNVLDGASAGYSGYCVLDGEKYYVIHGPCVIPCNRDPDASISASDLVLSEGTPMTPALITADGDVDAGSFEVNGLPPGLSSTNNSDTEIEVTGTPSQEGSSYAVATFTTPELDEDDLPTGNSCTVTRAFIIEVRPANITAPNLVVPQGADLSSNITANGDVNPGSFSVTGLPPGVTANLTSDDNIELTGAPTQVGTFNPVATFETPVIDQNGNPTGSNRTVTKTFQIEVTP